MEAAHFYEKTFELFLDSCGNQPWFIWYTEVHTKWIYKYAVQSNAQQKHSFARKF